MVIGHGDIAKVLTDRHDVIFMASGVSDSKETKPGPYQREMKLLMGLPKETHIVYFSSLLVYWGKTEYARHKRVMEAAVKNYFRSYTIIRLGNIDWGVNPNTLINYLKSHPDARIQNTYRHIVSLDEFKYWVGFVQPGQRNEMNIPGRMVYVPDLMKELHPTGQALKLNL